MNSITRTGIKSEYIAPDRVPAFSRRWQRAITALNVAEDNRPLMVATAQDAAEDRALVESKLIEPDRGSYHADLARLTGGGVSIVSSRIHAEPTSGPIVTNGPNSQPTAQSKFAVGLEVAA